MIHSNQVDYKKVFCALLINENFTTIFHHTNKEKSMLNYKISELTVEQFRCIESVTLKPSLGTYILVGADDIGKTTILEAIGLVLKQDQSIKLFETDYYLNDIAKGFHITAKLSPVQSNWPESGINQRRLSAESSSPPSANQTDIAGDKKYFILSAKGTKDLKLECGVLECVGISETELNTALTSLADTRIIGNGASGQFMRFRPVNSVEDLPRNSASFEVDGNKEGSQIGQSVQLESLSKAFGEINLPRINSDSDEGIVESTSQSNLMLVDRWANDPIPIPIQKYGDGIKWITHQLITMLNLSPNAIRLIDNFGGGSLDFIRQRNYFQYLSQSGVQSFITLKDLEVAKLAEPSTLWVITPSRKLARPVGDRITHYLQTLPNVFNAKLVIFAEGKTEVGFVKALLTLALGRDPAFFGLIVVDGTGNNTAMKSLKQFASVGLQVGAFVDNEGHEFDDELKDLINDLEKLFFQWKQGCIEENVIDAIYDIGDIRDISDIEAFDKNIVSKFISKLGTGAQERLRTIAKRLAIILKRNETLTIQLVKEKMGDLDEFSHLSGLNKQLAIHERFKQVMKEATAGKRVRPGTLKYSDGSPVDVRKFGSHGRIWFKSIKGGGELAIKLSLCNAWKNKLEGQIMGFLNANLEAVELRSVVDLSFPEDVGQIKKFLDSIPEHT